MGWVLQTACFLSTALTAGGWGHQLNWELFRVWQQALPNWALPSYSISLHTQPIRARSEPHGLPSIHPPFAGHCPLCERAPVLPQQACPQPSRALAWQPVAAGRFPCQILAVTLLGITSVFLLPSIVCGETRTGTRKKKICYVSSPGEIK